jgi:hypothetical protein
MGRYKIIKNIPTFSFLSSSKVFIRKLGFLVWNYLATLIRATVPLSYVTPPFAGPWRTEKNPCRGIVDSAASAVRGTRNPEPAFPWRRQRNPADARERRQPGGDPTKRDFPNFTHICNIFLQTCVKSLTNLWKINPTKILQILVYVSII